MIKTPTKRYVAPTDFTLRARANESFNPNTDFIAFTFMVGGQKYDIISDPENNDFKNCYVDGDALYMVFENYPFIIGQMFYRQWDRVENETYSDGFEDTFSKYLPTNIFFEK